MPVKKFLYCLEFQNLVKFLIIKKKHKKFNFLNKKFILFLISSMKNISIYSTILFLGKFIKHSCKISVVMLIVKVIDIRIK